MINSDSKPNNWKSTALTQAELLVAIAVLVLVVLFLLDLRGGHSKDEYQSIHDQATLRQIGIAMMVYVVDHDDCLPEHPRYAMQHMNHELSGAKSVWLNPYQDNNAAIDRGDSETPAVRFGGYVFINMGVEYESIEKPTEHVIAYTAKVNPDQTIRSVLFADGHVEIWEEEQLRAALPEGVDVDALDGP